MGKIFHEALLHWIWDNRQLQVPLQTVAGKPVIIHQTGRLNRSDGPDFKNAKIAIGSLTWHGHVEVHWKAQDWFQHKHDEDDNYKNVVLHVVYEKMDSDKPKPDLPTLCLKPFLSDSLEAFCEGMQSDTELHCAKNAAISPAALEAQIAKTHKQYFEQKVDDMLQFYDTRVIPSKAWQQMVVIALFDGLGILYNREPMKDLSRVLLDKYTEYARLSKFKQIARQEAFRDEKYRWRAKGSRPANHPKPRINQACDLLWHIMGKPVNDWFDNNIKASFEGCLQAVQSKPGIGRQRSGILYGTVWLPAIYLLGDLFGSSNLSSAARKAWMQHRTSLPESVQRPFRKAGVPAFVYRKKLGTVRQLRAYCKARQCHKCEVFKNIVHA